MTTMEESNKNGDTNEKFQFLEEEEMEFEEEELNIDITAEIISQANNYLSELASKNMHDVAFEFRRLLDACSKLSDEVINLNNVNNELKPKLVEADDKLIQAFQMTESSQKTIDKLKEALDASWKEIDSSRVREQENQEKLAELLEKCEKYTDKNVDEDRSDGLGQLGKYRQTILRERDRLKGEVMELDRRLNMQKAYIESLEHISKQSEENNRSLNNTIEKLENDFALEQRNNKRLTRDFNDLNEVNENIIATVKAHEAKIEKQGETIRKQITELRNLKKSLQNQKNEHRKFSDQLARWTKAHKSCMSTKKMFEEQVNSLKLDLKSKEAEVTHISRESRQLTSELDSCSKRLQKIDREKHKLLEEAASHKTDLKTKDQETLHYKNQKRELRQQLDSVTHEREALRTEMLKKDTLIAEMNDLKALREDAFDQLKEDFKKERLTVEITKRLVANVERQRAEQAEQVDILNDKIDYFQEQIQLKVDQIIILQENATKMNLELIKLKKLFESTNTDKIMLQRSLQNSQEENSGIKKLLSESNHQVVQLTEEMSRNRNEIIILNLNAEKLTQEIQLLTAKLRSCKKLLRSTRNDLKKMKEENEKQRKTIHDNELTIQQLAIKLEETRKEKNIVGTQMVRRNDEILLLKQKLDVFQIALDRGELQYNQRIEDIRLLKLEISRLCNQRDILRKGLSSTTEMKKEVLRLQRLLDQERIESTALREDLRVPVNIHRWRMLAGKDPDRHTLVQKVIFLQKRMLGLYTQALQREQCLQDCQKLNESLKSFMEKLPSFKVKEDLVKSQRVMRSQQKKLKALAAELITKDIDAQTKDCKIKELSKNLVLIKTTLYKEKKLVYKLKTEKSLEIVPDDSFSV